jgi:hypothetical protein
MHFELEDALDGDESTLEDASNGYHVKLKGANDIEVTFTTSLDYAKEIFKEKILTAIHDLDD